MCIFRCYEGAIILFAVFPLYDVVSVITLKFFFLLGIVMELKLNNSKDKNLLLFFSVSW